MNNAATTSLPMIRWSLDFGRGLAPADVQRLLYLLTALQKHGRLGLAAHAAGLSYRTAWSLLNTGEKHLGRALVNKARGRGTSLSDFAARLLVLHGEMEAALQVAQLPWQDRLSALLADTGEPARLTVAASHDLALADWIENGRRVLIDVRWLGSEDALTALALGECDAAGFHVPDDWPAVRVDAWLQRWLRRTPVRFYPLMRRRHGLILPHGNPQGVRSLPDIARLGLRIVNRQRGSGTRSMIDQLLAANGVPAHAVRGYAHEEFTHEAVAAAVASGQADAGFGIEAAAARYDLEFIALGADRYGLAVRATRAESPPVRELMHRLQGATFAARLASMPGYSRDLHPQAPLAWADFSRAGVPPSPSEPSGSAP